MSFEQKFLTAVRGAGIKAAMALVWWGSLALIGLGCEYLGEPDAKYSLVVLGALLPLAWIIVDTRKG